jgi:hypothetical protein
MIKEIDGQLMVKVGWAYRLLVDVLVNTTTHFGFCNFHLQLNISYKRHM